MGRTMIDRIKIVLWWGLLLFLLTGSNRLLAQTGGGGFGTIERISVSSNANQGSGTSEWPAISRNGRYIAYHSDAPNLVPNDTNNTHDIFLYDRLTRTTQRVSLNDNGIQGNNRSMFADLSTDGRYLTFHSEATNLVPNDTNNSWDVYFRDLQTGQFERISVTSAGNQANDTSIFPDISGDGRFIAFYSQATDLVPNDTNNTEDIFLHDRLTGTTERISVSSNGTQANGSSIFPDISADGRYVVYDSNASNLVPNDTNNASDIFMYDRINQTTQRISLTSAGEQGNGGSSYAVIAADNRHVTFVSFATNIDPADTDTIGDIYLRDLTTGTTHLISRGFNNQPTDDNSHYPVISSDGRFIAYHSEASNLVPGDTNATNDIFLYDRAEEITHRINLSTTGNQSNGPSSDPAISGNGRIVVFRSLATNLVPGDTNGTADVFLYIGPPFDTYLPSFFR